MPVTDILLDENGSIQISGGDLVIGESDKQHQQILLLTSPGEMTQFPIDGVGLVNYLEDDVFPGRLRARIVQQFEADGMKKIRVAGNDLESLKIDATY